MSRNNWNFRGLVSLMAAVGFLIITVTGLVVYIMPHGRIAYRTDWRFLGLSKTTCGDMHILGGLLLLVAIGFHIYFNWKSLMSYLVTRTTRSLNLKKEIAVSLIVGSWVVMNAMFHIPPLSYILDLNEYVKSSWIVSNKYEPPFGHAERLSFNTFCSKRNMPLEKARSKLKDKGITVTDTNDNVAEIAKRNGISPMELYSFIEHLEPTISAPSAGAAVTPEAIHEQSAGSGIGRKTLSEVARLTKMDPAAIQARLAGAKIELKENEALRSAAQRNKLSVPELLKVILIEDYRPGR